MTDILEQLRLASALCHNVAGAELVLHCRNAPPIHVSEHGYLNSCQLRHIVGVHAPSLEAMPRVTRIDVQGSIAARGGDLYGPTAADLHQRWFATFLGGSHVTRILETAAASDPRGDCLAAHINVDPLLAVTVVCMKTPDVALRSEMGRVATRAYRACMLDEIIHAPDPADRLHGVSDPVVADLVDEPFCVNDFKSGQGR